MRASRRLIPIAVAILLALPAVGSSGEPCMSRLLVLSAYPAEIDKLLNEAAISVTDSVVIDGRSFFVGTLMGNDVVMALTGIGLVNAERTTRTAIDHFRCGSETAISGIVFSGVAGGATFIGDVTVPDRWTIDDGATWMPVDPAMLATVQAIEDAGTVELADMVPLGDPACVGIDPLLIRTITMPNAPQFIVGGNGKSADSFGGRAFPCIPGGGNVFGCEPCRTPVPTLPDPVRFAQAALPFADPDFFTGYFRSPTPPTTEYTAEDMETAAVAVVATEQGIPFIAFRSMSDGMGDPLNLPGFPFQFFVYHQLAAENAAIVSLAFLEAWSPN